MPDPTCRRILHRSSPVNSFADRAASSAVPSKVRTLKLGTSTRAVKLVPSHSMLVEKRRAERKQVTTGALERHPHVLLAQMTSLDESVADSRALVC